MRTGRRDIPPRDASGSRPRSSVPLGPSSGDLQVDEATDVVDRLILDGPDRLEPQGPLPAQRGIVGGDDLKDAAVGSAHERDAPGAQAAHAFGRVELGMDLADEAIAPECLVAELDHLAALDRPGGPGIDPEVDRP